MQHANLGDVFLAGMQTASPYLQHKTAKLKKKNDEDSLAVSDEFRTEWENFVRDNPYDGSMTDEDKVLYEEKFNAFRDNFFIKAKEKNSSAYYQENIGQMKARSSEVIRRHILEAEDAWRLKQEKERNEQDLRKIKVDYVTEWENFIRDNPYNGDATDYKNKINNFRDEFFTKERGKNPSRDFQKNMDLIQTDRKSVV
jgi:hypothetical protein